MEFGIFLNGYIPGPGAHDTEWEHRRLMLEADYAIFADKHNWKYAWFGEHHSLTEYSHMSAPEVIMGLVAGQTDYIHLASGINSLSPRKEHPVRLAERAAMLDHVTGRRYEWGTGPWCRQPRAGQFQHPRPQLDEVGVGRGRPGDPADVGAEGLLLRRRAFHGTDAPQRAAQALRTRAPADLGRLRQPADVPEGGRARHRGDRLQLRADLQPAGPHRGLQGRHRELQGAARAVHERQHDDDQRGALLRGPHQGEEAGARAGQRLPGDHGQPLSRHHAQVDGRHHVARRRRSC